MEILLKIMRQLRYGTIRIAFYISPDCSSVAMTFGKELLSSEFCIHPNCMCVLAWNYEQDDVVKCFSAETI
jgi:hypothetical protein